MNDLREPWSPLPEHIEATVQTIAELHAEHEASAERAERVADEVRARLGRPISILLLLGAVGIWIGFNLALPAVGQAAVDQPPFGWLQLALSALAVLMTIVVLISQRRAETLNSRRDQLVLQLAFLSDRKESKIIALLEELRRDDPLIKDRMDHEAQAMAETADPKEVLEAIEETHQELRSEIREQEQKKREDT